MRRFRPLSCRDMSPDFTVKSGLRGSEPPAVELSGLRGFLIMNPAIQITTVKSGLGRFGIPSCRDMSPDFTVNFRFGGSEPPAAEISGFRGLLIRNPPIRISR